jgi:hypothetical protein
MKNRLKELRAERGWSQADLAEQVCPFVRRGHKMHLAVADGIIGATGVMAPDEIMQMSDDRRSASKAEVGRCGFAA